MDAFQLLWCCDRLFQRSFALFQARRSHSILLSMAMKYSVDHPEQNIKQYLVLVIWCNNNAGIGGWHRSGDYWFFDQEEIAAEFALKWT